MTFSAHTRLCNGQHIHADVAGPDDAPMMLMLHGFPEFRDGWRDVAERLADRYRVVLPDQRGYGLSSKPEGKEAYETRHLAADMVALAEQLSPDRPFILCGHDWGASVAYAMTMRNADRISHLIIANGVHPMPFQRALLAGGAQTDASQYINVLRRDGVESHLMANDFEKMFGMFQKFSAAPWLTDEKKAAYREAWSMPGAVEGMVNWYRSSPLTVIPSGSPAKDFPITTEMHDKYHISMPHLLLWGEQDTALLPASYDGLENFCADLTMRKVPDASHWILHEKPDWAADQIAQFLGEKETEAAL